MEAVIENMENGERYIAQSTKDCKDDVDKGLYALFCALGGRRTFSSGVMIVYNPANRQTSKNK